MAKFRPVGWAAAIMLGAMLSGTELTRAEWETLPVHIGAFHEAFNQIAQGGTTDLLAQPMRCGRNACYYQLTDLDGSVATRVMLAAGPPENNASSIELQAPATLALSTLGPVITTALEIAFPQLNSTDRLHVMRSLFADMEGEWMFVGACVNLVPGHWLISGEGAGGVVHFRIEWPLANTRVPASRCRHLVPADEVLAPGRYVLFRAQRTINDCERDVGCWVRHYPEANSWCREKLSGELEPLSAGEARTVDETPREAHWAATQAWPFFAFTSRWPKRTQSGLIAVEYSCTYDPLEERVVDAQTLPNPNPVKLPPPSLDYYLPRGAH
jgi:hypothetical protein